MSKSSLKKSSLKQSKKKEVDDASSSISSHRERGSDIGEVPLNKEIEESPRNPQVQEQVYSKEVELE